MVPTAMWDVSIYNIVVNSLGRVWGMPRAILGCVFGLPMGLPLGLFGGAQGLSRACPVGT